MSSDRRTVDRIVDQASDAGSVIARAMFGEYGLYCDGRMVGMVADDRLFMKMTAAGRAWAIDAREQSAYPGAKPSLLIEEGRWDDRDWLAELFRRTASELPPPKAKSRRA